MNKHNFSIIIEHDIDGYAAFCPELQGCYSQGATYEEALSNIEDAIKLHLLDRLENKEELSKDYSVSLSNIEVTV